MADESAKRAHARRVGEVVRAGQQAALSTVAASWCRASLYHGLDPSENLRWDPLDADQLAVRQAINREFLGVTDTVLDPLFATIGKANCCMLVADAAGVILRSQCQQADTDSFAALHLLAGSDWSEACEGTNGIGSCVAERCPVTISADQHFAARNIDISCTAAPLFDPQGKHIGVLAVACTRRDRAETMSPLMATLVQEAARQIERAYFSQYYAGAQIMYSPDATGRCASLVAVDGDGLVIGATRAARLHYKLVAEDFMQLRPFVDLIGLGDGITNFEDGERVVLKQALLRANGNISAAARFLGIGRATFYRRMERIGLITPH